MHTRRHLLIGAGLATAVVGTGAHYAYPFVSDLIAPGFAFEPIQSLPGFRRIERGVISAGFDPLTGIRGQSGLRAPVPRIPAGHHCTALFGRSSQSDDRVPIAIFSDFNCPQCRVMTEMVARRASEPGANVVVTWHELPLLSPTSLPAARAALAAGRQGRYLDFHLRLMAAGFQLDQAYLSHVAERLDLDVERFERDVGVEDVDTEIAASISLARDFGFIGTPAMVVGRTAVLGRVSERRFDHLIEIERAAGPLEMC